VIEQLKVAFSTSVCDLVKQGCVVSVKKESTTFSLKWASGQVDCGTVLFVAMNDTVIVNGERIVVYVVAKIEVNANDLIMKSENCHVMQIQCENRIAEKELPDVLRAVKDYIV
jgi:hypothetical protein